MIKRVCISYIRPYHSFWVFPRAKTNHIFYQAGSLYHSITLMTCYDRCNSVKVTSPFSSLAAIVHYSFSSGNEKRAALLLLDPTDFISDDATSNLSYSSQTNTFCQSQNTGQLHSPKPQIKVWHKNVKNPQQLYITATFKLVPYQADLTRSHATRNVSDCFLCVYNDRETEPMWRYVRWHICRHRD